MEEERTAPEGAPEEAGGRPCAAGAAGPMPIPCLPEGFQDPGLLRLALTHVSRAAEESRAPEGRRRRGGSYERLEFLGDRVLGLAVAEHLHERFGRETEGDLSKRLHSLVSRGALSVVARRLRIDRHILRADGHEITDSMRADCFEALIGAVHLDGGWEAARAFVFCALGPELEGHPSKAPTDPKTRLQEWSMKRGLGTPDYEILSREGPEHEPLFHAGVSIQGVKATGRGSGRRLRDAERIAATLLLESLEAEGGGADAKTNDDSDKGGKDAA